MYTNVHYPNVPNVLNLQSVPKSTEFTQMYYLNVPKCTKYIYPNVPNMLTVAKSNTSTQMY